MALGEWLEEQDPFATVTRTPQSIAADKKANDQAELIWAQKFKIFESGVAKEILDHLTMKARRLRLPPNASATEFAFYEGQRELVEYFHARIEFANNGGQSPYKER